MRRLLLPVVSVIALLAGLRASGAWDTLAEYLHATPFGRTDPLFGRDLGFYFFVLPFWRLLYGWALGLAMGALALTALVYVLQRSVVLTARGPRLAGGARTHLLLLGAVVLLVRAWGFWLDRFELLYSARGLVFGASYTDVHASLPALQVLAVLAVLCAVACVVQTRRPGWRFLVAGLVVLGVVWVGGLSIYPALLQRFRVTPNELVAERPFIEHNIRLTRQAYGLDRIAEQDFPAEDNLDAAALERNSATIKNIRLWDHRPLLVTYGQLQEIRTYYKFLDVDNDRYTLDGEYRQVMLSARELSYRHRAGGVDQPAPHLHPRLRGGGGTGQPDQPGRLAGVPGQGHPARVDRLRRRSPGPRSTTASRATTTCSCARARRSSTTRRASRTSTRAMRGGAASSWTDSCARSPSRCASAS